MALYHKDVFLPKRVRGLVPDGIKELVYSRHAMNEAKGDRFGEITLPKTLKLKECELIEVDTIERKFVLRKSLDNGRDLVIVVIPSANSKVWGVKTVWINLADDVHKTLDKRRYEGKP